MESLSTERTKKVTLEGLENIFEKNLTMDMTVSSSKVRIRSLFVACHSLLRRNGLSWVIEDAQKIAVDHVLGSIKPASLLNLSKSDLAFFKKKQKMDFFGFMPDAIKLYKSFKFLDMVQRRN